MHKKIASFQDVVRQEKGFTLIELLVVIVIIGILAAGATAVFGNTQGKARNAVRRGDLKTTQNAIELFKANTNGNAPTIGADYAAFNDQLTTEYLQALPVDPGSNSYGYFYKDANQDLYKIYGYDEIAQAGGKTGIVFGVADDATITAGDAECTDGTASTGDCATVTAPDDTREWSCTGGAAACGD